MFSDGLPDARRGREFFGEERIHQILDTMRDAAPQLIVDSLMREVTAFSGEQHTDDIAILAASVLPAH
jgi:sigma-B regulation protein RsbU (phosphoserine phosphatase)